MSSRGSMIGSAPSSGLYSPKNTPADEADLPTYINDELLTVSGVLNGILEGGAFPPTAKMPKRFREGMMIYFIQGLAGTDITSAGIWLYRRNKWWKIVDDPSEFVGAVFIYKKTPDDKVPLTPPPSTLPPSGWLEDAPDRLKSEYIWISRSNSVDEGIFTWAKPVMWAAGVEDGVDGKPGAPGIEGDLFEQWFKESSSNPLTPPNQYPPSGWVNTTPQNPTQSVWMTFVRRNEETGNVSYPWSYPIKVSGTDGTNGSDGERGTVGVSIDGTAWNNQAAWNAIVSQTGTPPIPWDTVTISRDNVFVETRRYVSGNNPGTWSAVAQVVDGDSVIHGTLAAEALVAKSLTAAQISAGAITGNEINAASSITIGGAGAGVGAQEVVRITATGDSRLWIGNQTATSAKFSVDKDGNMTCRDANIRGTLQVEDLVGSPVQTANGQFGTTALTNTFKRVAYINASAVPYERKIVVPAPYFSSNPIDTLALGTVEVKWNISTTGVDYIRKVSGVGQFTTAPRVYTIPANTAANITVSARCPGSINASITLQDYIVTAFKLGGGLSILIDI